MHVSPVEYLGLRLRAHELLHDVPLYDVSAVDLPGGGAGRSIADIRALDSSAAPSLIANALYGLRHFLGRVFSWDRTQIRLEESLLAHTSIFDRDRAIATHPVSGHVSPDSARMGFRLRRGARVIDLRLVCLVARLVRTRRTNPDKSRRK